MFLLEINELRQQCWGLSISQHFGEERRCESLTVKTDTESLIRENRLCVDQVSNVVFCMNSDLKRRIENF